MAMQSNSYLHCRGASVSLSIKRFYESSCSLPPIQVLKWHKIYNQDMKIRRALQDGIGDKNCCLQGRTELGEGGI